MIKFDATQQIDMKSDPVFFGAFYGAKNAFGDGTGIHDPISVATEVFEDTVAKRATIKNPLAYGRTLGFRRATSYLRRAKVEERHRERKIRQLRDSVECAELHSVEEWEQREEFLFHILGLSSVDAHYVFLRIYCELPFRTIKTIIDSFTGNPVTVNTHQTRYAQALDRFKRAIASQLGD